MTGRKVFYYGEMNRMIAAENIVTAFYARKQAKDWADWAASNPRLAARLAEAEKLNADSIE